MERRSWGSDCPLVHCLPGAHGHLLHGATSLEPKCFTHVAIGSASRLPLIIAYLAWVLALALFIGLALPVALRPRSHSQTPPSGHCRPLAANRNKRRTANVSILGSDQIVCSAIRAKKRGVSGCHERQKPAVSAAGENAEPIEKASRKLPEELRTR